MNDILRYIFFGFLQGFTEFFPVSSSAHVILLEHFMKHRSSVYSAYDLAAHLGVLLAICVYFAKELVRIVCEAPRLIQMPFRSDRSTLFLEYPYALILSLVAVSCVPTLAAAIILKGASAMVAASLPLLGISWLLMAALLFYSRHLLGGERNFYEMNHRDAFMIGISQGASIIPGFSRSGLTILTGLYNGIERKEAVRFSFLLSIPSLLAVTFLKIPTQERFFEASGTGLLISFLSAAFFGFVAIHIVLRIIEKGRYHLFGYYCAAAGLFTLGYYAIRHSSL